MVGMTWDGETQGRRQLPSRDTRPRAPQPVSNFPKKVTTITSLPSDLNADRAQKGETDGCSLKPHICGWTGV